MNKQQIIGKYWKEFYEKNKLNIHNLWSADFTSQKFALFIFDKIRIEEKLKKDGVK